MLLQPAVYLSLLLPSVLAAFTPNDRVCWRRNCVVRTDAGTLCFEPQGNTSKQECTDSFLKNLLQIHLASTTGRSIMYYDEKASLLGAATWTVPHDMAGSVFVCMSGQLVDDPTQHRTVCRESHGDDDMAIPAAHARECVSDEKLPYVGDGCFRLGKQAGGEDDDKEWYEQPVLAGLFWLLGVLVTLEKICLWADSARRLMAGLLPMIIVTFVDVFILLAHRWRHAAVAPLPAHQPAVIA